MGIFAKFTKAWREDVHVLKNQNHSLKIANEALGIKVKELTRELVTTQQQRDALTSARESVWAFVKKNKGGKYYWVVETGNPHRTVAIGTGKFTDHEDAVKDAENSGLLVNPF